MKRRFNRSGSKDVRSGFLSKYFFGAVIIMASTMIGCANQNINRPLEWKASYSPGGVYNVKARCRDGRKVVFSGDVKGIVYLDDSQPLSCSDDSLNATWEPTFNTTCKLRVWVDAFPDGTFAARGESLDGSHVFTLPGPYKSMAEAERELDGMYLKAMLDAVGGLALFRTGRNWQPPIRVRMKDGSLWLSELRAPDVQQTSVP